MCAFYDVDCGFSKGQVFAARGSSVVNTNGVSHVRLVCVDDKWKLLGDGRPGETVTALTCLSTQCSCSPHALSTQFVTSSCGEAGLGLILFLFAKNNFLF